MWDRILRLLRPLVFRLSVGVCVKWVVLSGHRSGNAT